LDLLRSAPDDGRAIDKLAPVIYSELKGMAAHYLRRERAGATLQPTALVHEAYLRLVDGDGIDDRGRTYFFGAAARAMRQLLIERARARGSEKRGGDRRRVPLGEDALVIDGLDFDVLSLDEALEELAALSERQARVVELRFFGGLDVVQVADLLEISDRTVKTDWRMARAWLRRKLAGRDDDAR